MNKLDLREEQNKLYKISQTVTPYGSFSAI